MSEPYEPMVDGRCDAFAALGVRDPHALMDADAAVARIIEIYDRGVAIVAEAFEHFKAGAKAETIGEVAAFYPFVGIKLERHELNLDARRSFGALHDPGIYGTTVTRPALFGDYYRRQIGLLIEHHKVPVIVGISHRRMPLPFVIEDATADIRQDRVGALEAAFALPDMRFIDDAIANGTLRPQPGEAKPLALFTAERVDYSLQRVHHYTATSPEHVQRFILLTNYQRYIEHFIDYARDQIAHGDFYDAPGRAGRRGHDQGGPAGRGHERPSAAPSAADAGLSPDPRRPHRDQHDQYRHRALERAHHHRPPGGAAAALLADPGPLRRPAPHARAWATTCWLMAMPARITCSTRTCPCS